ncbi:MAG: hypothetical protein KDB14_08175, partial [Planctomycetales bacterium]|nr:hypothetical protein [Planctomycetales bacterium]
MTSDADGLERVPEERPAAGGETSGAAPFEGNPQRQRGIDSPSRAGALLTLERLFQFPDVLRSSHDQSQLALV